MKSMSLVFLSALSVVLPAATLHAQPYPTKPVRVVVPFAPGGGSDITARQFSQKLSEALKQQFVVDNRGGAGGLIGMEMVAKAQPDGYTIMMMSASFAATSALHQPAWQPIKSIVPVIEFGSTPFVLVVHPSVKANNVKELIALASAKPNGQTYASTGLGGITHLATELFMNMTSPEHGGEHVTGGAAYPGRQTERAGGHHRQALVFAAGYPAAGRQRARL